MSDKNFSQTQDQLVVPRPSAQVSQLDLHTERAEVAREQLAEMCQDIRQHMLDIGYLLEEIHRAEYWRGHYASFEVFIEEEVGFSVRKAQELIKVIRYCQSADIQREEMASVGWSKLAIVAGDLTKENAAEVLAGLKRKSCRQLKEEARQRKAERKTSSPGRRTAELIVTEIVLEAMRYACLHTRDMDFQTNLEFVAAKFLEHCPSPARVAEPSLN